MSRNSSIHYRYENTLKVKGLLCKISVSGGLTFLGTVIVMGSHFLSRSLNNLKRQKREDTHQSGFCYTSVFHFIHYICHQRVSNGVQELMEIIVKSVSFRKPQITT